MIIPIDAYIAVPAVVSSSFNFSPAFPTNPVHVLLSYNSYGVIFPKNNPWVG